MISVWFSSIVALVAITLGAVVVARGRRHPAHLSFGVGMVGLAIEAIAGAVGGKEPIDQELLVRIARLRLLLASVTVAPWVVFSLAYSRGDWQDLLRRWRIPLILLACLPPLVAGTYWEALALPGILPITVAPIAHLGWSGYSIELLLLGTSILVLTNLERTFRHIVGVMRWRTKYVFLAVGAVAGFRIYASSQALLYRSADVLLGSIGAAALLAICMLLGVALFRSRILDADVYPSQALVFGSVTILLTGAYLVTVGVVSQVLGRLGSASRLPLQTFAVTLALAGLAIFLLSERIRQRLRNLISRHLHRPTFDYRLVWSSFTRRTRSLIDEEAYGRAVTHWLSETFSALSVSLWRFQVPKEEISLTGSTAVPISSSATPPLSAPRVEELSKALKALEGPENIDLSTQPWAAILREMHPTVFPQGGNRIAVPVRSGDDLLGVLVLGDRVEGHPFNAEDLDLLTCAADQIASGLLGLQLSRQLVRSKELEAFQTMSAFFVHDLKNTASTLTLTLRNLQTHFGDPAFREDALRAVGKSAQHLNDLIGRLTRLRQEWRVHPEPGDLVAVTRAALTAAGQDPRVTTHTEFCEGVPVLVDAVQMEKVIVNLILNARDAMPEGGLIHVRVFHQDTWGGVSVTDHGCGMTPDFVRESLFRPFQTTKRNGLGIGVFHCKTIVDAHGGRMEVETAPGRGTTMRVLVPVAPAS